MKQMTPYERFKNECRLEIEAMGSDRSLYQKSQDWRNAARQYKYSYHFEWLGRPIIQYPQDIIAMQELVWTVKPDLIIETGIAHGGSLVMFASLLALLDISESMESGTSFDPRRSCRKALGIDIEIRPHNRAAIEAHPLFPRIMMIEGSSIDSKIISQVYSIAEQYKRVMVSLDSNHSHDHVIAELEAYAPLVSPGSYCIVFDTIIEDMPENLFQDRPWGKGNNPKTAAREYLKRLKSEGRKDIQGNPMSYEIDKDIEHKLMITVAPDGYLRRAS